MKKTGNRLILAALMLSGLGLQAHAADVGVSVSIGDPNFYGRIDIGNFPQPRLIYPEPVIIQRGGNYSPVYMRVPPGHAKDWKKHCKHYDACGRPVYFVQDDWYEHDYAPAYREKHGKGKGKDKGHGNENDQGHGKGKGHGKGHGKD